MFASIVETLTQRISDKMQQIFKDFAACLPSIEHTQQEIKKQLKDIKLRSESCTKKPWMQSIVQNI